VADVVASQAAFSGQFANAGHDLTRFENGVRLPQEGARLAIHPGEVKEESLSAIREHRHKPQDRGGCPCRTQTKTLADAVTKWQLPDPMAQAFAQAKLAAAAGEVPIGAVVIKDGTVIAAAHNAPRAQCDPTAHAEMLAIRKAALILGNERLDGCELWVTLEPCAMCAGAIVHARIARLYYGASDAKGGAVEHGARLFEQDQCLHRPEVYPGIGEVEAAELLRGFFRERR
jgi:tRNA(adenine34) deaminase